MENFPSIFPYSTSSSADHPPPHLSFSNTNYSMDHDDHHNHPINNSHDSSYIEFQGDDKHHRITDGYLGLVAKDAGLAIVNQSSSSTTSTSPKADHDHQVISPNSIMVSSEISTGVKMGKIVKKDKKMLKKPRYAFQTRSQVDILDDGYRWRKYGQKSVKNNNFPRSYYRCTHQGCNVKKQVQRLSQDEGVVVTTYEGMHSHPIEKSTDNFEHILTQMKIYSSS